MRKILLVPLLLLLGTACPSREPPTPMVPVGERVTFPGIEYTILEATDRGPTLPTQDGADSVTTAGKFVDVRFVVKNASDHPRTSAFNPLLVDQQNRTFGGLAVGIVKFYVPKGTLDYRWYEMKPGEEAEFRAIYQVDQADATDLHLEVSGDSGEVAKIDLPF